MTSSALARQLATNLRAWRDGRGMSQERLGELLGKHRTYIGRIESGKENLTLAAVERLAAQLGLHPLDLLEGDIARSDRDDSGPSTEC